MLTMELDWNRHCYIASHIVKDLHQHMENKRKKLVKSNCLRGSRFLTCTYLKYFLKSNVDKYILLRSVRTKGGMAFLQNDEQSMLFTVCPSLLDAIGVVLRPIKHLDFPTLI